MDPMHLDIVIPRAAAAKTSWRKTDIDALARLAERIGTRYRKYVELNSTYPQSDVLL